MMGVRADITPQVARIDAHLLNRKGVTRLCYCGSVLHTRPAAPGATREPIQIGAEMYGEAGVDARRRDPRAAVPGAARSPARATRASTSATSRCSARIAQRGGRSGPSSRRSCSRRLQRKDVPALKELDEGARHGDARTRCFFCPTSTAAPRCSTRREKQPAAHSRREARARHAAQARARPASSRPASTSPSCAATTTIRAWCSTRIATESPGAVARGGRYDEVGKAFGRARPATGFSIDLRSLAGMAK